MAHQVYELDVRLRHIEPPIWRTIEIAGSASLEDVHYAIQIAMGWTNSHLHQFVIDDELYGMADMEDAPPELGDERRFRLQDLAKAGDTFVYEYDFGDGWEHDVTVKKVTSQTKSVKPRCTDGKRACPPEDCGGPHGYSELLVALRDPKHPEHESSTTWVGDFQPERFAVPKADLSKDIAEIKALADEDAAPEFPEALAQAILALDPMQRAALGSLIAHSLATELIEVRTAATKLVTHMNKPRGRTR